MNSRSIVNDCLRNLGKTLGISLTLEENGVCAIQIEEGLPFIIEVPENSHFFYLSAPLKSVSGDAVEIFALFGKALAMNLFQVETGGGALAYSERLQEIVYCLTVPIEDCDAERFARIVTDFITHARKLKDELMEEAISSDIE